MDPKYFIPLKENDETSTNKQYQCQLCHPKKKIISSSVKSNSNLVKHIERVHPSETNQFRRILEEKKLKRRTDGSE
jgi:hypothetical protein